MLTPSYAQKGEHHGSLAIHKDSTFSFEHGELQLTSGDSVVIQIIRQVGGDVRNDQGFIEEYWIILPEMTKDFVWEPTISSGYLIRRCRCQDAGANPIVSGKIKGKKTDNAWKISVETVARGHDTGEDYTTDFNLTCVRK